MKKNFNQKQLNTKAALELHLIRRRRWLRVGGAYLLLLFFSLLFIGPFVFGLLSSLKDNPLEWPPKLSVNQLKPSNWSATYKLGKAGCGKGFFGEFAPGAVVPFKVTYLVPVGKEPVIPQVAVPRRVPGTTSAALLVEHYAADYSKVSDVEEIIRETLDDGSIMVTYKFTIYHTGDVTIDRLPLDITVPLGQKFIRATLDPNRPHERLGRVQSWNNLTSGVIPYIFYNYHRVFRENYSRTTGKHLFSSWIRNSFFISITRVITTLLFASMAGFALARLNFVGKNSIFLLMLFSMMIPGQVTFISNYLVLRDGVFGISKLFGVDSLLNNYSGLIISGLVSASSVFIMKQFFEGLPASLEEAARIDGASTYQIFFRIFFPLAKPALGALTILTFQGAWNEFFWPLVVLTSPQDRFTLTIGLLSFRKMYGVAFDWGPILAGSVISALPLVILFIVFQRYFVEGISFTGTKG
jgi:multiple sugar transport system permease protein